MTTPIEPPSSSVYAATQSFVSLSAFPTFSIAPATAWLRPIRPRTSNRPSFEARRAPGRPDSALVYGATVQLPTFDKAEPRAWFRIADANFGIRWVTDPVTKYYYVLSKLDSETLRKLTAFLDRPLGSDPYPDIRKTLCKTFEPSLEAKLDAFLATTDAGDERPAEFGLELQRLLANASTDDLLKRVFLRSLKPTIVTAITSSLTADFETVMAAADRAWTAASTSDPAEPVTASVSAISGTPPPSTRGGGRGGRGARGSRQRGSRPSGQIDTVALCHYHKNSAMPPKNVLPGVPAGMSPTLTTHPLRHVFQVEEALDSEDSLIGTASEN